MAIPDKTLSNGNIHSKLEWLIQSLRKCDSNETYSPLSWTEKTTTKIKSKKITIDNNRDMFLKKNDLLQMVTTKFWKLTVDNFN